MFLYLYLFIDRYQIGDMHIQNIDIEEIVWWHKFSLSGLQDKNFEVYIKDMSTLKAFFDFLDAYEEDLIEKKTIELKAEDSLSANPEDAKVDLHFLYSDKNYIVAQGVSYCASFIYYPNEGEQFEVYKGSVIN